MRTNFILTVVASVSLIAVIGCQNSTPPHSEAGSPSGRAIVVSGGNSPGFTVFLPSNDPAQPEALCSSGQTACPECKAAAAKYFETGALDTKCSRTGATRTVATATPFTSGHN